MINTSDNWERRWHPLRQEWVVVAARTSERPWSGALVVGESGFVLVYLLSLLGEEVCNN
jgi:UDPglucose--hexose-1-phosphate uridylyltransferase